MQSNNLTNFIIIKRGKSFGKVVARIIMAMYVLIFSFLYNFFELMTYQKGFYELSNADVIFFTFAIGGSLLCLILRFIIFIRIAQDVKSTINKLIMMACQILCIIVLFVCLLFLLYYTGGIVDWYYLRVYGSFEWSLLCIVMLQWTIYLACNSWTQTIEDAVRFKKQKSWKVAWSGIFHIFCFISSLILTWLQCSGVIEFVKQMKSVVPY